MKVLIVHNRYRSALPSGENAVVDADVEMLGAAGIEVATFFRDSDEFESMSPVERTVAATSPITGWSSGRAFARVLATERPDIVHVHNPYPLISPSVIRSCREVGVPIVATVHNYRLRCPNGLLFRDGEVCTECVDRRIALPAVVHGCYRESRAQSVIMTAAIARHRRTWDGISGYIAVSQFVKDWLQRVGVPGDVITVIPNPVADQVVPQSAGSGFLHAGRLAVEKGSSMLLDAWEMSGLDGHERLVIAGDGPLYATLAERATRLQSVDVVGLQDREQMRIHRVAAAVSVMPSLVMECASSAPESFATARPVIATQMGGLVGVVDQEVGWSISPTTESLATALRAATDVEQRRRRGAAARHRYDEQFHPDVVLAARVEFYKSVIG